MNLQGANSVNIRLIGPRQTPCWKPFMEQLETSLDHSEWITGDIIWVI